MPEPIAALEGEIDPTWEPALQEPGEPERCEEECQAWLTPEERLKLADEMARAISNRVAVEERKKEYDSQAKAEIDAYGNQALAASRKLQMGYEFRRVACIRVRNYEERVVVTYQEATGAEVKRRPMRADEVQMQMGVSEAAG